MALIRHITCRTCGNHSEIYDTPGDMPTECAACAQKRAAQDRAQHLAGLKALTLEERIARIEEWIYDYKPPINIHDIRF